MATLSSTTVNGTLKAASIVNTAQDYTPWYRISHCLNSDSSSICDPIWSCGYIHVRTPLPADYNSGVTWTPSMLEVIGFHTYSGEYTHYFKAIVNVTDTNIFAANVRINLGNTDVAPRVYRSDNQYGGKNRVCFAMRKYPCCCVGWFWVRWRKNASFFDDYPWGLSAYTDTTTNRF